MSDEIRNDDIQIQEENVMERSYDDRPDPEHYYPSEREYDRRPVVSSEDSDDGHIGTAEVLVGGAAAVGVGTVGYLIYKGVKWCVDKIRGVDEEDDEYDEDEEDDERKPRRKSKKASGSKKKKKVTSKKARKRPKPEPEEEDDFEDEDEESESEEK